MDSRKLKKENDPSDGNDPKKQKTEEEDSSGDDTQNTAFLHQLLSSMMMSRQARYSGNSNDELVQRLKSNDVFSDNNVEEALKLIPRGEFVPESLKDEAYLDNPLRLANMGFNISAPHMYAVCLENLKFQEGNSFLDVGSGCGHLTALAAYLVGKKGVSHGLDLRKDITDFSEQNVRTFSQKSGIDLSNCKFFTRNCFLPTLEDKRYDRIHCGACCPSALLEHLINILAPGGILVTPYEDRLIRVLKDAQGKTKMEKLMGVRYSDLIIPSEAEIKEALRQIEHEKATRINVPENTYMNDFARLCNNPDLSDVKFIVEGKEVFCHKVILAARSEHFRSMFFSGMKESNEKQISLPSMQYQPFIDCLTYIYSGNLTIMNADHAIEILEVANYLKIDRLKALCEILIKNNIEVENSAYILQVASQFEAWQLKSFAMRFIIENYEVVEKTKCFDDLPKNLMKEVLSEACKKKA